MELKTNQEIHPILKQYETVGKMLRALIGSIQKKWGVARSEARKPLFRTPYSPLPEAKRLLA